MDNGFKNLDCLTLRTLIKSEYIKLFVELHDIVLRTNKNRLIPKPN